MNPKHPHGNRRDETELKLAQRHRIRPVQATGGSRSAWKFDRLTQIGRLAFCRRNGRISFAKLGSIALLILASFYIVLVTGLLPIDVAGPLVKRALEEKLGRGHQVEIGETRFMQNASGQAILSVHGIVIKGPEATSRASAAS